MPGAQPRCRLARWRVRWIVIINVEYAWQTSAAVMVGCCALLGGPKTAPLAFAAMIN
jgi:hypothetical protein